MPNFSRKIGGGTGINGLRPLAKEDSKKTVRLTSDGKGFYVDGRFRVSQKKLSKVFGKKDARDTINNRKLTAATLRTKLKDTFTDPEINQLFDKANIRIPGMYEHAIILNRGDVFNFVKAYDAAVEAKRIDHVILPELSEDSISECEGADHALSNPQSVRSWDRAEGVED